MQKLAAITKLAAAPLEIPAELPPSVHLVIVLGLAGSSALSNPILSDRCADCEIKDTVCGTEGEGETVITEEEEEEEK